jgi:hypothetical protein
MIATATNAQLAVIILAGAASPASASDLRIRESFSSIADMHLASQCMEKPS